MCVYINLPSCRHIGRCEQTNKKTQTKKKSFFFFNHVTNEHTHTHTWQRPITILFLCLIALNEKNNFCSINFLRFFLDFVVFCVFTKKNEKFLCGI